MHTGCITRINHETTINLFLILYFCVQSPRDVICVRRLHTGLHEGFRETQTMTTTLKKALKTHFGFDDFRTKLQEDVVKAVVRGKSVNKQSVYLLLVSLRAN